MKFITKILLALSMLATLSFAGEMGHGMKSKHNNMEQSTQQSKHMMDEDPDMKMDKNDDMGDDSGMMMKKSGNKPSKMSCGAGKCGAGKCGGGK
jgi:hypothetical protein